MPVFDPWDPSECNDFSVVDQLHVGMNLRISSREILNNLNLARAKFALVMPKHPWASIFKFHLATVLRKFPGGRLGGMSLRGSVFILDWALVPSAPLAQTTSPRVLSRTVNAGFGSTSPASIFSALA